MRKTFTSLMVILALPVCGFGHGSIHSEGYEKVQTAKNKSLMEYDEREDIFLRDDSIDELNVKKMPYVGATFVIPTVGVSLRPKEFVRGAEYNIKTGVIPGALLALAGDVRFFEPINKDSGLYFSIGVGSGGTLLFSSGGMFSPVLPLPLLYGTGSIGFQKEKGFIDAGIDLEYGYFPLPTLRAGFRF